MAFKSSVKVYTIHQALIKAMHFCAFQERAHSEVRKKLSDWGITRAEAEHVIAELITENYLNEERFTRSFVRGKFAQKGWGKLKIKQELYSKQVSETSIELALSEEISQEDYLDMLKKLCDKKYKELKSEDDIWKKKQKIARFLSNRGFESNLIQELLNTI